MSELPEDDADHDAVVLLARLHMEPDRPGKRAEMAARVAAADEDDLVNAAIFGRLCLCSQALHEHDLAPAAADFAWCEREWSARGHELAELTIDLLLAVYSLLITNARGYPTVPFTQISIFVEALIQRHRQYGRPMRTPYMHAYLSALVREDDAAAAVHFRRWQAEPEGPDDSPMHSVAMEWDARRRDWDSVLVRYAAGLAVVSEYPWTAEYLHAGALEALVRLGRLDDADRAQRAGYAAIDRDDPGVDAVGDHLRYCELTGQLDRGVALVAEFLPDLDAVRLPGLRVGFCEQGFRLLRAVQRSGGGGREVRDGRSVDDVAAALRAEAENYAQTIDRVNDCTVGTDALRRIWADTS